MDLELHNAASVARGNCCLASFWSISLRVVNALVSSTCRSVSRLRCCWGLWLIFPYFGKGMRFGFPESFDESEVPSSALADESLITQWVLKSNSLLLGLGFHTLHSFSVLKCLADGGRSLARK